MRSLLVGWIALVCTVTSFAGAAEEECSQSVDRYWNRIRSADSSEKEMIGYWVDVARQSQAAFRELWLESRNRKQQDCYIRAYVKRFGASGESDIRWLLADSDAMLAQSYQGPRKKPEDRELQIAVCKAEVERFLDDRKLLHRYYRALLWSEQYLGNGDWQGAHFFLNVGMTREGFKEGNEDEYWWFARHTLLLLHATGRTDMLRDKKPEGLKEVFFEWEKWLQANHHLLRADPDSGTWALDATGAKAPANSDYVLPPLKLPSQPFTDWDGPYPSPRLVMDLW